MAVNSTITTPTPAPGDIPADRPILVEYAGKNPTQVGHIVLLIGLDVGVTVFPSRQNAVGSDVLIDTPDYIVFEGMVSLANV